MDYIEQNSLACNYICFVFLVTQGDSGRDYDRSKSNFARSFTGGGSSSSGSRG